MFKWVFMAGMVLLATGALVQAQGADDKKEPDKKAATPAAEEAAQTSVVYSDGPSKKMAQYVYVVGAESWPLDRILQLSILVTLLFILVLLVFIRSDLSRQGEGTSK